MAAIPSSNDLRYQPKVKVNPMLEMFRDPRLADQDQVARASVGDLDNQPQVVDPYPIGDSMTDEEKAPDPLQASSSVASGPSRYSLSASSHGGGGGSLTASSHGGADPKPYATDMMVDQTAGDMDRAPSVPETGDRPQDIRLEPAKGSGGNSSTLPKPASVDPKNRASAASPGSGDSESIEDLRKRMGLVEYGAPARGAKGSGFGQSYTRLSKDVGDGRGSFSAMKTSNYKEPLADVYDRERRASSERHTTEDRARTEDLQPVNPIPQQDPEFLDVPQGGATSTASIYPALPMRKGDLRKQQAEQASESRMAQGRAAIRAGAAAALQDLRSRQDFQLLPPLKKQEKEDELRADADQKLEDLVIQEMLVRKMTIPNEAFRQ